MREISLRLAMQHERFTPAAGAVSKDFCAEPCFHCGSPIPDRTEFGVRAGGAWRPVCCAGCQAVATSILGQGLGDFYRLREIADQSGARPAADAHEDDVIYDAPAVQSQFVRSADGYSEAILLLENVRCAACIWLNEQVIAGLPGVHSVQISYTTRRAIVRWEPERIQLSRILGAIRSVGYRARPYDPGQREILDRGERRNALWRIFVAAFGMMQIMMYAFPSYLVGDGDMPRDIEQLLRWASLLLTLPVMFYSAAPFFSGAARDIRLRRAGMDVPIAMGIGIAFLASLIATWTGEGPVYFDSIAMFVCLLLVGRYLEVLARQKAVRALQHLGCFTPELAHRLADYPNSLESECVQAASLRPGELVAVRAGDAVPADGVVVRGASKVNEAILTGESRPLYKNVGDVLAAGAVNMSSGLVMRVTRAGTDTTLSGIVRMVERAAGDRPRFAETADRVAGFFVLVVLGVALLSAIFWINVAPEKALWVTVSVLVATCPCAFSLATPVALTAATGAFAHHGIIPAGGHAITTLARATDIVFDKTGTLTGGAGSLLEIRPVADIPAEECLRIAAMLEANSSHPVAVAILASARYQRVAVGLPVEENAHPGEGVEATDQGRRYRIGTPEFVTALCPTPCDPVCAALDRSAVWLGGESGVIATLHFDEELKICAKETAAALRAQGCTLHLLTGDSLTVANRVAALLGIERIRSRAKPQDKHDYVRALQREGRVVAMVGDGVNDAPVMAQADVSIAMGDGARLAQLNGDLVLMSANLAEIAWAVAHARRTLSVIRQNIAWAFAYNLFVIPLATGGVITPWAAALGMSASSLLVVLNALRLVEPMARPGVNLQLAPAAA